jgi:hypothetical protein
VLIDETLAACTGHYDAGMNSIGPAYANLARSGLLAVDGVDLVADLARRPRGVVMVAPMRRATAAEASALLGYVHGGGNVLVAAGLDTGAACAPLMAAAGLAFEPLPLGTVPPEQISGPERLEPRVWDGWPLRIDPAAEAASEPLFRYGDHLLAVLRHVGSGHLAWIADSRFFSDQNVESPRTVWPGNVRFLELLFARMFGGSAEHVAERFPSPEKPK